VGVRSLVFTNDFSPQPGSCDILLQSGLTDKKISPVHLYLWGVLFYQKIVDEWSANPEEVPYHTCVNALEALGRPEEALQTILKHPRNWNPRILARFYEELGRKEEAILIYAGLSYYSYKLSEAYYPFWQPHYLQEGADLCEKAGLYERLRIYKRRAIEAWEKMKGNIGRSLHFIEEAWLFEEVGYI